MSRNSAYCDNRVHDICIRMARLQDELVYIDEAAESEIDLRSCLAVEKFVELLQLIGFENFATGIIYG